MRDAHRLLICARSRRGAARWWLSTLLIGLLVGVASSPLALPWSRAAAGASRPLPAPTFRPTPQPDDPPSLHEQAVAQITAHDWDAAEDTLRALLTTSPDDAVAHLRLGMLLAPVEPETAAQHLLRAEADPQLAGRARRVLDALPDGSRGRGEALAALGIALGGAGEWALAQRALELALEASAANPVALAYLGYALDQQGLDGLSSLERARAMAPTDPQVNYLLGLHWRLAGDYEAAHAAFLRAYWAAPENPALAAELGLTLREEGDLAQAEAWLRIAVALEPDQAQWTELLAAFYAETGFGLEGGGLTFLEAACGRAPDNASLRASLGWALHRLGQTARAHKELSAAVALAPADVRSRYYFGIVLEAQGDGAGALQAYMFVVEHAPAESLYAVLAARGLARLGAPG